MEKEHNCSALDPDWDTIVARAVVPHMWGVDDRNIAARLVEFEEAVGPYHVGMREDIALVLVMSLLPEAVDAFEEFRMEDLDIRGAPLEVEAVRSQNWEVAQYEEPMIQVFGKHSLGLVEHLD